MLPDKVGIGWRGRMLVVSSLACLLSVLGLFGFFGVFQQPEEHPIVLSAGVALVVAVAGMVVVVALEYRTRRRLRGLARVLAGDPNAGFNDFAALENEALKLVAELRESRDRRERNVNNLPGMLYRCKNDEAWTLEFVSCGARELTGYEVEDLLSGKVTLGHTIIDADYRELVWEAVQSALKEHRPFEIQYRATTRSGAKRWFWERGFGVFAGDGSLLGIEGFITDITEMRLAANEIRAREEDLADTLNSLSDGVVVGDLEGRIVRANAVACRLAGKGQDIQRRHFEEVFDLRPMQSNVGSVSAFVHSVLQSESGVVNRQKFELTTADGRQTLSISLSASVRLDHHGKRIGVVLVMRDVTQEERLQEQLQQSQKLEAIGQLAGGVAHDFNNLLSVVIGYTELAMKEATAGRSVNGMLKQVGAAANRAARLTEQLLDFSRKQILTPRAFDLNANIRKLQDMLEHLMPKDVSLTFELAPRQLNVLADPAKIDQILINLVVNARDAVEGGGSVTVATALRHPDDDVPRERVEFRVRDTGCGIEPSALPRIFDPFYTTKAPGKGTGLGLSVVQGIVAQSHGRIEVESRVGVGTEFRVTLPCAGANDPVAEVCGEEAFDAASSIQGMRILLIEDEEALRELVESQLALVGCQVQAFGHALKALEVLKRNHKDFDAVLSDVVMPDMTGTQLLAAVKKAHPQLPVVLMSGYPREAMIAEGREAADGFLGKPFELGELVSVLCSLGRHGAGSVLGSDDGRGLPTG